MAWIQASTSNGKAKRVHDLLNTVWFGVKSNSLLTAQHGSAGAACNARANLLGWATKSQQRTEHRKEPAFRRTGRAITVWKVTASKQSAVTYPSAFLAAKATGAPALLDVANGKQKQSGGYYAEWAEDAESQEDLEGETWREVHPKLRVSNLARAQYRSTGNKWLPKFTPRANKGFAYARIGVDGKVKLFHQVVYDAFFDDRAGRTVDHKDRHIDNNKLSNLRAATQHEQNQNQTYQAKGQTKQSLKKPVRICSSSQQEWIHFDSLVAASEYMAIQTNRPVASANVSKNMRLGCDYRGWRCEFVTSPQADDVHQQGLVVSDLAAQEEEED